MASEGIVASGATVTGVAEREIRLGPGDMLVVEPGEAHTFLSSTEDYLHYVIQAPFLAGDKVSIRA